MIDPRVEGLKNMLRDVEVVIPVVSGKGGVGKSLISTTMALLLSREGKSVGLLDLDFHGACDHVILGANIEDFPEEDKGVLPPIIHGVKFMTIAFYSKDMPVPLRGTEITNAILELLAVTRWEKLNYLIVDMPPGLGDTFLETIKLFDHGKYVVVTTPSILSVSVVRRLIMLLNEQNLKVVGIIENMKDPQSNNVIENLAKEMRIRYLGWIGYYPEVNKCIGNPNELLNTKFARDLSKIIKTL